MKKQRARAISLCATLALLFAAFFPAPVYASEAGQTPEAAEAKPRDLVAEANEKQKLNPDVVGWLYVPGTEIDFEINFSPVDNEDYLTRRPDGTTYFNGGSSFADFRSEWGGNGELLSPNLVIYGRTIKEAVSENAHLFDSLRQFQDMQFARTHPYIYFATLEQLYVWEVFAVSFPDIYLNYNDPNMSESAKKSILTEIRGMSLYDYEVEVAPGDNIITLSTNLGEWQYYDNLIDYRYVIMAKQVANPDAPRKKVAPLKKNARGVNRMDDLYIPTPEEEREQIEWNQWNEFYNELNDYLLNEYLESSRAHV